MKSSLADKITNFTVISVFTGILLGTAIIPTLIFTSRNVDMAMSQLYNSPNAVAIEPLSQKSIIYDKNGSEIATFYSQNRIPVPLDQISPWAPKALVALEDSRFFEHNGVDVVGIIRAFITSDSGASTITQQYVRNLRINQGYEEGDYEEIAAAQEKSLIRKLGEARSALIVESQLTKEEILENYLNIVYYSNGNYGIEAAAQNYFGISAKDLNIQQAATLVGIVQSPSYFNPITNPENSLQKRNLTITKMYDSGDITREQYLEAIESEFIIDVTPPKNGCAPAGGNAYFCDYVQQILLNDTQFGETRVERQKFINKGGLQIHTTLDPVLQEAAVNQVFDTLPQDNPKNVAAVINTIESRTGKILAMAQNRVYTQTETPAPGTTAINFSVSRDYGGGQGFQVGSTYKPFTLVNWLQSGKQLDTVVNSNLRNFPASSWRANCDGVNYADNYSSDNAIRGTGYGYRAAENIIYNSYNTGTLAMANQLDLCDIRKAAEDAGVVRADGRPLSVTPSSILGTNEIAPLTMAAAYTAFSGSGIKCSPKAITKIIDIKNNQEYEGPGGVCSRAYDSNIAMRVNEALEKVLISGTAAGSSIGVPAAAKTGTTDNNSQNWILEYTTDIVTVGWMGNPNFPNETLNGIYANGRNIPTAFAEYTVTPMITNYMKFAVSKFGTHEPFPKVQTQPEAPAEKEEKQEEQEISVPELKGTTPEEASRILRAAGFEVSNRATVRQDASLGSFLVITTNPPAGTLLPRGTSITLIVTPQ